MSIVLQVLPREGMPDPEGDRLSRLSGGRVRAGWLYRLPEMDLEDLGRVASVLGDPVLHEFVVGEDVPEEWAAGLEAAREADPGVGGLLGEVLGRPVEGVEAARLFLVDGEADREALAAWLGRPARVLGRGDTVGAEPGPGGYSDRDEELVLEVEDGLWAAARLWHVRPGGDVAGDVDRVVAVSGLECPGQPVGGAALILAPGQEDAFTARALEALERSVHLYQQPILTGLARFGAPPALVLGAVCLRNDRGTARSLPDAGAAEGPPEVSVPPPAPDDPGAHLLALLASPNLRSRDAWWRRLDFEGLGSLVVRPLSPRGGPMDGAVAWPLALMEAGSPVGIAVAVGAAPSPAGAAAEARFRAVACGGDPARLAVGVRDLDGLAVGLALAAVPDVRRPATMEPLRPGDRIFVVSGAPEHLHSSMHVGLVASCKHVSEGGLAVALALMVVSSGLGVRVQGAHPFAEWPGRFVVTVRAEDAELFAAQMGEGAREIGDVTVSGRVDFGPGILDVPVARLREAWTGSAGAGGKGGSPPSGGMGGAS